MTSSCNKDGEISRGCTEAGKLHRDVRQNTMADAVTDAIIDAVFDAVFNHDTDESSSEGEVVVVDAEVAAPVVVPKRKRKRDDEPVTDEGRSLRNSMIQMKAKLGEVMKKSRVDRTAIPWFGGSEEERAMWKQSIEQFDLRVRGMESLIKKGLKDVGNEAGDLDNIRTIAFNKCEYKLAALKARRARDLEAVEKKYSTLLADEEKKRDDTVAKDIKNHKNEMAYHSKFTLDQMDKLERGCAHEFKHWHASRQYDMFLQAVQEGRVLDGSSEMCVQCKSSKCFNPGCGRYTTIKLNAAAPKPFSDKLRDVLSERARTVNGAIALFCASGESCVISLSKLTPEHAAVAMPCKHVFDKDSIAASLQTSNKCPSCRALIFNVLGYTGEKCKALKELSDEDL